MIADNFHELPIEIEARRDAIARAAVLDAMMAGDDDAVRLTQAWRIHPEDRDLFARVDVQCAEGALRTVMCRACKGLRLGTKDGTDVVQHHADDCPTRVESVRRHAARVERFRAYCERTRGSVDALARATAPTIPAPEGER